MKEIIYISSVFLLFTFDVLSQTTIKIDGFFDDWNTNINTYIDDSTDSQGVELLAFSICNDNEYLYVRIRLSDEIDLTETFYNPAEVMINIDADNNSSTGYYTNNIGSEYGMNFFDKFIFDDTNFPIVDTLSLYDLDIIPLPTYSSDEFEIAINRFLFSDTISISISETIGNDYMPDNSSVFTYIFDNCSSPTTTAIDFSKNDSNNLRLMTYNVWSNGLVNNNRVDEHRRIFTSANADIITFQECGNTTYNDVLGFLNTSSIYYPYIYPNLNSGNLTISKYPSLESWQVADRIDAELIDLPDSIYSTDILILNGHPPCCGNNQGRQEHFDALIQFIHDAKTVGGVIDLPINTPISFSGDMNLVGYSEQYYTILNGTISDTVTFGNGGFPDWDNTPLEDQICYFNEKDIAYTWDKSNPSTGDFPPGRLDFVFFTNSVMSVDKSFIISTEHMSPSLLSQNNLLWNDTKIASDHFPVIVDFILPNVLPTEIKNQKSEKDIIRIIDLLGRDVEKRKNTPLFYIYDDGTVEKKIILE
jgi:endonuclease/exonuclease/phosphatase family metal-dependent hydrolase